MTRRRHPPPACAPAATQSFIPGANHRRTNCSPLERAQSVQEEPRAGCDPRLIPGNRLLASVALAITMSPERPEGRTAQSGAGRRSAQVKRGLHALQTLVIRTAGGRVLAASDIHLGATLPTGTVEDLTAPRDRAHRGAGVLRAGAGGQTSLEPGDRGPRDVRTVHTKEGRLTAAFGLRLPERDAGWCTAREPRLPPRWEPGPLPAVTEAFLLRAAIALELKIDTAGRRPPFSASPGGAHGHG